MEKMSLGLMDRRLRRWDGRSTFHCNVDARRQKQSPEAIVEDLIALQGRRGVIGDLDTWAEGRKAVGGLCPAAQSVSLNWEVRLREGLTCSEAVEDPVFPQHGVTVGADEHSCLRISEDVVFLQQTWGHTAVLYDTRKDLLFHRRRFLHARLSSPRPPLNIQMPPSLPSWILFLRRVGLLSVLIHTPAMALSKISLSSMKPKPENMDGECVKKNGAIQADGISIFYRKCL